MVVGKMAISLFLVLGLGLCAVGAERVMTSGGSTACPANNEDWLTARGVRGAIIDRIPVSENFQSAAESAHQLFHYMQGNPVGYKSGPMTAAACFQLCQQWPVGPDNITELWPANDVHETCSHWSWDGIDDCFLFSYGVCNPKDRLGFNPDAASHTVDKGRARFVSGGGPGQTPTSMDSVATVSARRGTEFFEPEEPSRRELTSLLGCGLLGLFPCPDPPPPSPPPPAPRSPPPPPPKSPPPPTYSPPPPGVKGDPHFAGWDGVHFDFTGSPGKSYCLLSDSKVHLNMHLSGYMEEFNGTQQAHTWITGLGVIAGPHTLTLLARTGAEAARGSGYMKEMKADGKVFRLEAGEQFSTADGSMTVEYEGPAQDGEDEIDVYAVTVEGSISFKLKMRPEINMMRRAGNAWVHFSIDIVDEHLSSNPHGILGQSLYNLNNPESAPDGYAMEYSNIVWAWQVAGSNGDKYIQGYPKDYMTSGILSPDCKYTRLEGAIKNRMGLATTKCSRKNLVC